MKSAAETPRRNLTGAIVPALAAAAVAGAGALFLVINNGDFSGATAAPQGCILMNGAENIGGPFALIDENGTRVTQADFSEGPSLLYFGFTHCPDVCPTTMYTVAEAMAQPGGYDLQAVMISLDPARDTPAVMRAYVRTDGFPSGLVGLTGAEAQVNAVADEFKVVHSTAPIEGRPAGEYTVNHSSFLYVMDEHWRTRAIMPTQNATPATIAQCIAAGLEHVPQELARAG
ncbi:SCO family protein [Terricaulis sp.]|uniref:SCO family protein n=1 Tax=Terricaulis sp. TaxID=2768686 RepID=UPI003783F37A